MYVSNPLHLERVFMLRCYAIHSVLSRTVMDFVIRVSPYFLYLFVILKDGSALALAHTIKEGGSI